MEDVHHHQNIPVRILMQQIKDDFDIVSKSSFLKLEYLKAIQHHIIDSQIMKNHKKY